VLELPKLLGCWVRGPVLPPPAQPPPYSLCLRAACARGKRGLRAHRLLSPPPHSQTSAAHPQVASPQQLGAWVHWAALLGVRIEISVFTHRSNSASTTPAMPGLARRKENKEEGGRPGVEGLAGCTVTGWWGIEAA